jgi:TonB family protein
MLPRSGCFARLSSVLLLFASLPVFAAQVQQQPTGTRKIVRQVAPIYPALAKNTRTSGAVKLNITVDRNGVPKAIDVVGGNPVLVKAAQECVNKWKWAPVTAETIEHIELRFQPN